jgi:hypothetical protein
LVTVLRAVSVIQHPLQQLALKLHHSLAQLLSASSAHYQIPFEAAYGGHLPSGLYAPEDHTRFDPNGYQMRNATIGGYGNTGYDMGGNNWNNGAFGQNNTLNGLGGTGSRRPQSKGRAGLPSVRP